MIGAAAAVLVLFAALVVATRQGPDARHPGGQAPGSNHPPPRATIPPVNGLNVTQAASALTQRHLVPEQHSVVNDAPAGTALYTDPAAGEVVKNGGVVALYVSSGPPPPKEPHHKHEEPKKDNPPKHEEPKHHHPKEKHL